MNRQRASMFDTATLPVACWRHQGQCMLLDETLLEALHTRQAHGTPLRAASRCQGDSSSECLSSACTLVTGTPWGVGAGKLAAEGQAGLWPAEGLHVQQPLEAPRPALGFAQRRMTQQQLLHRPRTWGRRPRCLA